MGWLKWWGALPHKCEALSSILVLKKEKKVMSLTPSCESE
jgi:hypothetical protein